ncbi:Oidioi.mRNA.OKI2018_I69.chr1.g1894.t1.cds [Oikopleura dioica]|uniref:Oidioi.mRNA.OKI2018_I69.chr1.g1894.t1.cds n=1 Tax=Oikopleura dioica TaxID=34765 RepID=A0ABN7SYH9_OIKDI|nr:Oidioi.mRNA.OKI2018_I69.chr1.g1894.t1.cds [Oikopleura dioica]
MIALLRHRAVKILSLLLLVALVSIQLLWQPSAINQSVKLSQIKSPKLSHKKPPVQKNEKKKSSKPASSEVHHLKQEKIHVESPTRPPPEPSTLKATTTKPVDDVKITDEDSPIIDNNADSIIEMSEKPSLPSEEETLSVEKDSEIIDVQSYDSQTFSVSKDFWMHASPNTKAIFAQLPVQFEKEFKNPCFWQKFEGEISADPYLNSPYAPVPGEERQYDPWGHNNYYRKARADFIGRLNKTETGTYRFRCLPYFYLISTPKSGTTTLWNQMVKHPDVDLRIGIKENAWWNFMRRGLRGDHHWVYHLVNPPKDYLPNDELLETLDQFMDLFDNEGDNFRKTFKENGGNFVNTITALAPINLLTAPIDFWEELHPELVKAGFKSPPLYLHPAYIIHKVQPSARLVALIRDPTERLYSDWQFFNKKSDKKEFHELVKHAVAQFQNCLDEGDERKCLYSWKLIAKRLRLNRGLYAPFLEDLFKVFPRNQVLVMNFDHFTQHQLEANNEILRFLNMSEIESEKSILKKAFYNRWFIDDDDKIMLPETRKILDDFYGPFNKRLATLLGDESYRWDVYRPVPELRPKPDPTDAEKPNHQ